MLPTRIKKPAKSGGRWKSAAHCNFVRGHHCCVSGCTDLPIEVAHVRAGSDGGMGRKPSDFYTISLCRDHHAEQHRIGEATFAKLHGLDLHALAAAFAAISPKAYEIRKARADGS